MRILAYFSFSFAAGCLLKLAGLSGWGYCAVLAVLLLFAVAGFLLRGRKERAAAILMLGAACGLIWTAAYQKTVLAPALAEAGENRLVTVMLTEYPQKREYGWHVQGIAETEGAQFRTHVYWDSDADACELKPGDRISGIGDISPADSDGGTYYNRSVGVPMELHLDSGFQTEVTERISLRFWPAMMSQKLRKTAEQLYAGDVVGYAVALLTGDKDCLSYQQKSDLQVSGVYHALAVSGMHVSILLSVLYVATMKNRRLYPLLGFPVLVFYCVMIGGAASVVRASVMHAFLMLGHLLRRESDAPTALGASLLVLAIQNPWCLMNLGLQLSFLSTAGILLFCTKMYLRMTAGVMKNKSRLARWLIRTVAASVACNGAALAVSLPLLAYSFGVVSTLCVVANLLVLPAITVSFVLVFCSCFAAWIVPFMGAVFAFPATLLLHYAAFCCKWIAHLPFAAIYPQSVYPVLWLCLAYGCLLAVVLRKKPIKRNAGIVIACCLTATLCLSLVVTWLDAQRGEFSFQMLDVGQGQCLLLRSGRQTAAVDCGGEYGDEAGEILARELLSGGNTRLDVLVVTHYDEDHTGGVRQLLYRVPVGMILMPDVADDSGVREELERLASEAGTRVCYVSENQRVTLGQGLLDVYAPVSTEGGNASSLSVLTAFDEFNILITGDLSISGELELIRREEIPDLEVMVAGHHGSDASTGALLMRILKPEYLIISVGENVYGHPAAELLERAESAGITVYRTDLDGTIRIRR